jgi:DNA-binding response OmpR family regulator
VNGVWPNLPLILLVAEDASINDECKELTGGNVLQLPFTSRKVTNRVAKLLSCRTGIMLAAGALTLNLEARCVSRGDSIHRLTPRQARLLEVFMRHTGQTLTRKFLMETVWETNYMGDTRTLDVHVRWIRERIEQDPSSPKYLRTVRGIGYRFGVPAEEET